MPETEVEQQPAANTEAVKEEKKEIVEESAKNEDGSEKKDEAEKKEKAEPEKKEKAEKPKKVKEVVPPPPAVHKKDFEKDVVYLYQFNRTPTIPSMSPYCLKVETWLKLNGIKYEVGILVFLFYSTLKSRTKAQGPTKIISGPCGCPFTTKPELSTRRVAWQGRA